MVIAPYLAFALATTPVQSEFPSQVAIDLYDTNKRELSDDKYYSSPFGTQEKYFLDSAPEQGQSFREPTGKRSGYYTVPRGKTTYKQGKYDRGRYYIQPNAPYPGDKPHEEYQPNKG